MTALQVRREFGKLLTEAVVATVSDYSQATGWPMATPTVQCCFSPREYQHIAIILRRQEQLKTLCRVHQKFGRSDWWFAPGVPTKCEACDDVAMPVGGFQWVGGYLDKTEERALVPNTGWWSCGRAHCDASLRRRFYHAMEAYRAGSV